MAQVLNPNELKQIALDAEMAELKAMMEKKKKANDSEKALRDAFDTREVPPEATDRINNAVRIAAEHGKHEVLVLRFPSSFCNDGGRRINNMEKDWPDSLEGFAKTAYTYFMKELSPLGYKLRTQIVDYPGGMPGDVGMYLHW